MFYLFIYLFIYLINYFLINIIFNTFQLFLLPTCHTATHELFYTIKKVTRRSVYACNIIPRFRTWNHSLIVVVKSIPNVLFVTGIVLRWMTLGFTTISVFNIMQILSIGAVETIKEETRRTFIPIIVPERKILKRILSYIDNLPHLSYIPV